MSETKAVEHDHSSEPYIEAALAAGGVPIPELDVYPTVRAVEDIHVFYTSPGLPEGTLNERLRKRNAAVRGLFAKFAEARTTALQSHIESIRLAVRCKNSGQSYKSCPGSYSFGNDYSVFEVMDSRDHMKTPARKTNDFTIAWTIGATGRGKTNTGWVSARAKLSPSGVARRLDGDVATLRNELRRKNLPDDRAIDPV